MKNRIVLVNYADEKYQDTQEICSRTGKIIGRFDEVISYTPNDIDSDFKSKYKNILKVKRGGGLWLWKPYVIKKALGKLNDGDYLFYCDSGAFFVRSIKPIIQTMDQDIWVTNLPLIEHQWTKPSCITYLELDMPEYTETNQIQASFILIRKSKYSVRFVDEWLKLCCDYDLISPEDNIDKSEEFPKFIAHREDQSLFSLLCKKEGILPHKDPSQFGRYPEGYKQTGYLFRIPVHTEDRYEPILVLHRHRSFSIKPFLKNFLLACAPQKISDCIYSIYKRYKR